MQKILYEMKFHPLMKQILDPRKRLHTNENKQMREEINCILNDGGIGTKIQTNESQQNAIVESLSRDEGVTLVMGPPGTGKVSKFLCKWLSLPMIFLMTVISFTLILH